ncbi:response regulator, partial [Streptomyces carpinensis]
MIRTLVVDDDFRVGQIHSDYVHRVQGFEVVGEAATVAEALAAVRDLRPDLLLLDVFLPDGTGIDILRQLSQDQGDARPDVLMITADHDITSVRATMKLGAIGYLVKPFGSADLAERLTAYRQLRDRVDALSRTTTADQADVDALFSAARPPAVPR